MVDGIPEHEINIQVSRILRSPIFAGDATKKPKAILATLLRYLIDKTIAGSPSTEILIGCEVFQKRKDWSPTLTDDTTVRTHVSYLRRHLANYYATEGKDDPYIITFKPKGGYKPTITPNRLDNLTTDISDRIFTFVKYYRRNYTLLHSLDTPILAIETRGSMPDDPDMYAIAAHLLIALANDYCGNWRQHLKDAYDAALYATSLELNHCLGSIAKAAIAAFKGEW